MKPLQLRRYQFGMMFLLMCCILMLMHYLVESSLINNAFWSGWVLFSVIMLLMLLSIRKKFPFLALGKVSLWLQFHIYGGIFALLAFLLHIDWRYPNGTIELILSVCFILVTLSGIIGTLIFRRIPPRLKNHGEPIIFERVLGLSNQIKIQVSLLVQRSIDETDSIAITSFFQQHLLEFFSSPHHFWHHCIESNRPLTELTRKINAIKHYLSPDEWEIMQEIQQLACEKYQLDQHYTGHILLKSWLFIHIPITYSLLLFIILHMIVVYAYIGG